MYIAIAGEPKSGKTTFVQTVILPRLSRVVIFDPNGEYSGRRCKSFLDFVQHAAVFKESKFVLTVTCDNDGDYEEIFELCFKLGNVCIIIDEAHLFTEYDVVNRLLRLGRHRGIRVVTIAHSLFDFKRVNRQLFTAIIAFRINETFENRFVREAVGEDVQKKIQRLKTGDYLFIKGDVKTMEGLYQ